ncbi:MAG: lamin tail domain-containing protein, partial [Myxococcota bacterium]
GGGSVTGGGGGSVTGGGGGSVTGGGGGSVTGGGGGATGGGGGGPDTAAQLTAVRTAADLGSTTVSLPVQAALVTFVKPLVPDAGASDPAGFFVQAGGMGPALFVAVDPTTLPTAPGDVIDFTVTGVTRIGLLRVASSISGFVKQSSGTPVSGLAQTVSTVDFAGAGTLDAYESELVSLTGTLVGDMAAAGSGYQSAALLTTGTLDAGVMKLRLPNTLADAEGLSTGCAIQFSAAPMWRFNAQAQPSAFSSSTLVGTSCPAPRLVSAVATSLTSVRAQFDRPMNPGTVSPATMSIGGLSVSTVTGAGMQWVLTTGTQTPGASYTLTAATSVADLRGSPISSTARTATFSGYIAPATALVINEVDYDNVGTDGTEFIEVFNPGGLTETLSGKSIVLINGGTTGTGASYLTVDLSPAGSLAPGEYLVLANANLLATLPGTVKKLAIGGTASATNLVQNGPTDAVALIDTASSAILDALSYQGQTSWTSPNGTVVVQEGTASTTLLADSNTINNSVCRVPNGADTNSNGTDFAVCSAPTPGAVNVP